MDKRRAGDQTMLRTNVRQRSSFSCNGWHVVRAGQGDLPVPSPCVVAMKRTTQYW